MKIRKETAKGKEDGVSARLTKMFEEEMRVIYNAEHSLVLTMSKAKKFSAERHNETQHTLLAELKTQVSRMEHLFKLWALLRKPTNPELVHEGKKSKLDESYVTERYPHLPSDNSYE